MILPATVSTLNATFRGRDRALAFGLWGAVMAGAAAVGPLLGGWLTTTFDWRWIFLINVPLSLVVVGLAAGFVTETRGEPGRGFDLAGLLTSGVGLGLLVFGLIEGPDLGWLTPKNEFTLFDLTWPDTAPVSLVPLALGVGALTTGMFLLLQRLRASEDVP